MGAGKAASILWGASMNNLNANGNATPHDDDSLVDFAIELTRKGEYEHARQLLKRILTPVEIGDQADIRSGRSKPILSFNAPIAELWVNRDEQRFKIANLIQPGRTPDWILDFFRVADNVNQSIHEKEHFLDADGIPKSIDNMDLGTAVRAIIELVASETNGRISSEIIPQFSENAK